MKAIDLAVIGNAKKILELSSRTIDTIVEKKLNTTTVLCNESMVGYHLREIVNTLIPIPFDDYVDEAKEKHNLRDAVRSVVTTLLYTHIQVR